MIAFIGSVFSPYYAWAGRADPLDHCAVNVALYSERGGLWSMTERRRSALSRTANDLAIGSSRLRWDSGVLSIDFDEIAAPIPKRLRGAIRVTPSTVLGQTYDLGGNGRHLWRPIGPRCEVEVELDSPRSGWRGAGYLDTNTGVEPLEDGFSGWTWSRAHLPSETMLFYDVTRRNSEDAHLALAIGSDGRVESRIPGPLIALPPTLWRVPRSARALENAAPSLVRTLEDAPFYARSRLRDRLGGETADIVHESLAADRLRSPIVRAMLPFRMPRSLW